MRLQRIYAQLLLCVVLSIAQYHSVLAEATDAAAYVGRATCVTCHAQQNAEWLDSHHDLAMQAATPATVLGDFNNVEFNYFGTTSTFLQRDGQFFVRTDGAEGKLRDYVVKYTFGIYPLQQYLLELTNGRLQAFSIAWDTRPKTSGGQRWFHLYPSDKITHADELHWTGWQHNWNSACAECHSTDLQKHYDSNTQQFATTFAEIDVACEACHGPGRKHLDWTQQPTAQQSHPTKGLSIQLNERKGITWLIDAKTKQPHRSQPRQSTIEIEMCARCHARRALISEQYQHGEPLMQTHIPSLLEDNLYYVDGQIQDEVYVYGSFLQSKMYQAGVTCSDCHNPHSLQLRASDQQVCLQCHLPSEYQTPQHHFHTTESTGANCIACHMPVKTYMGVDPRHDHSFRVPNPSLAVQLETPNVCNTCHTDQSTTWAIQHFNAWYGQQLPHRFERSAKALAAARLSHSDAEIQLQALIKDIKTPAIVRATALAELAPYLSSKTLPVVNTSLGATHPLIRLGAVRALEGLPIDYRVALLLPLLDDPIKGVRTEVARLLAPMPTTQLTAGQYQAFKQATQAYIVAQQANAERPEAQVNLGLFFTEQGKSTLAQAAYQRAIKLEPSFMPAYVNLADLYRLLGNEANSKQVLHQALQQNSSAADVHHALGLLLIREKKLSNALKHLAHAATYSPENAQYGYVYGLALNEAGQTAQAITVLAQLQMTHPRNPEILDALIALHRAQDNLKAMATYLAKRRQLQSDIGQ